MIRYYCYLFQILGLLIPISVQSQVCTINQLLNSSGLGIDIGNELGTSFTACGNGEITSITVNVLNILIPGNATLKLVAGTPAPIVVPDYTQPVTINATGDLVIPLTTPFPVTNLSVYSFGLIGVGTTLINLNRQTTDVLAGARLYQNVAAYNSQDLRFNLMINLADPIPTLSHWGLIFLLYLF